MENDWRLTNQIDYLYKVKLKKVMFKKTQYNDHEHCEFWFAKFGEEKELLHEGYCTIDNYHWICKECLKDFLEYFKWELE